jgi:hypothetical protein
LFSRHPFIGRLREIFLALLATTLGLLRSLRGERFQTWRPAESRVVHPGNF